MTDRKISMIFEAHADTVYRVCFTYFKGSAMDAEDAMQTVFLNMIKCGKTFESPQHERAWLITVASNVCKNMLKSKSRKFEPLMDTHLCGEELVDDTFHMILELPQKYKLTIYLFYYEGYSAKEIGAMLGKKTSTIWKYLGVGRDMLREQLAEEMS